MIDSVLLEATVLKTALKDPAKFAKLKIDFFSTKGIRELFNLILIHNLKSKTLPSPELLIEIARAAGKLDELREVISFVIHSEAQQDGNFQELLNALQKRALERTIEEKLLRAADFLSSHQIEKCLEELSSSIQIQQETEDFLFGKSGQIDIEDLFPAKHFVPTGFEILDNLIGGFAKQEFIIVAAEKQNGKSSLLLNILYNAYRLGKNVALFNLEMSKEDSFRRLIAHVSRVSLKKMRVQDLTPHEIDQCKLAALQIFTKSEYYEEISKIYAKNRQTLAKMPFSKLIAYFREKHRDWFMTSHFIIKDLASPSIATLGQYISDYKNRYKIDVVAIDYIDLISHVNAKLPMWERLKDISNSLKAFAKKFDIVLLTAAQLNPREQDTKYSKGISEAADIVFAWELSKILTDSEKIFDFFTIKTRHVQQISGLELCAKFDIMQFEIRKRLVTEPVEE